MNKPRVNFHSRTETVEQIIGRVAFKLDAAQRMLSFSGTPRVDEKSIGKFHEYANEQKKVISERNAQIFELCKRARTAPIFELTLDILSEQVTLVDLDKEFKKGGNGKWTNA